MSTVPRVARLRGLVVAALCVAGCGGSDGDSDGEAAAYVAVAFPSGDAASVADLRGDAVLLAGWATWCVPCERELPELDAFAGARAADGLRVVAVNVDTPSIDDDDVSGMLERLDVSLPVWRDSDAGLLAEFGGTAMPFAVLLDRDGRVVRIWNGAVDVDDTEFLAAVDSALT